MTPSRWMAALAIATAGASCAYAAETQIAYHKSNGTQVFVERKGDRLLLRSLGPANVTVGYEIDADADGVIDPLVDVSYGMHKDGTLCAARWISETATSHCGTLKTTARSSQEAIGELVLRRLDVPLSEVARNGRTVRLRLEMYDAAKGRSRAWLAYDLATGEAASSPPPPASATASTAGAKPASTATATNVTPVATAESPVSAATAKTGLSDHALTDRYDGGEVYRGRECRFRQLPEIRIHADRHDRTYGEFMVRPRESSSVYNNELMFVVFPDGREKFRLVVSNVAHQPARVTSATLMIDGARFPLEPIHPIDKISPVITYRPYVSFERLGGDAKYALTRASTARLELATKNGVVSQWTYPVGNFRYLRRAMELSGWKCTPD